MNVKKNNILEFMYNKKNLFSVLLVFLVMFSLGLALLDRATYSSEEEKDSLELICDESIGAGGEFKCSVVLNSVSMLAKRLTSKYNLDEGIIFKKFELESEAEWSIETSDEDGFVIVNLSGLSGKINIGTITLSMFETAKANEKYMIELVDATIGDGEDAVVNLDDVSDEVRIYSDINTLESISLSEGTLNEEFNKDRTVYTADIDSDKITIEVTKTDENSSITGNIGEQNLHYGTNKFEIIVTSEDGTDNIYKLDIFRKYHFTNDVYTYSEDNNYLYTGSDTEEEIYDNITLEDGLNKKIEDGKLIISNENEKLLEINILSVMTDKYIIEDKVITVDNNLSLNKFINNMIITSVLDYKMLNNDIEVNEDEILVNEMIFEIYYSDNKLDSYKINVKSFELSFDESIVLDKENMYIKYLNIEDNVSSLLGKINIIGGYIKIFDVDGYERGDTSSIATGDKLVIYKDDEIYEEYMLSVLGDINGDGRLSLIDLVQVRKHIVGFVDKNTGNVYEKIGVYFYASDMNQDGKISLVDLVRVRKEIVG